MSSVSMTTSACIMLAPFAVRFVESVGSIFLLLCASGVGLSWWWVCFSLGLVGLFRGERMWVILMI